MNLEIKERCIELVYKIINSENGIELVDEDLNYYLKPSKELKELSTLFDKNNKYEVNYICGLFILSESDLKALEQWKNEMLSVDVKECWDKCIIEYELSEEYLLDYIELFLENNFVKCRS